MVGVGVGGWDEDAFMKMNVYRVVSLSSLFLFYFFVALASINTTILLWWRCVFSTKKKPN